MLFRRRGNRTNGRHELFADTIMTKRENLNAKLTEWLPNSTVADLVLLVAHFPSTFEAIEKQLNRQSTDYQLQTGMVDLAWLDQQQRAVEDHGNGNRPKVILCLAEQLRIEPKDSVRFQETHSRSRCRVSGMIVERHFLRVHDDAVVSFFSQACWDQRIGFFLAMDDRLVQTFSNPALFLLLEHYGLNDDRAVDSPLVARHVRFSQKQFARRVIEAKGFVLSPDQWLEENCPDLLK